MELKNERNTISVDGSAYYKAYVIGEEVEVLMKPNEPRILNIKNAFFIISGIGALSSFVVYSISNE